MTLTLLLRSAPTPFVTTPIDPDAAYSPGTRVGPTTLLEIVRRACDEMGLRRPDSIYASSVNEPRQMLGLLNAAGRDLVQCHPWTTLVATAAIDLSPGYSVYPLPSDFDRLLDAAAWDNTNQFPVYGSITQQRHAYWLSSGVVGPTTHSEYQLKVRLTGNSVYIHPPPSDTVTLHFRYVRNTWVLSGNFQIDEFSSDTDTTVFNPQLMVKELKWRFKAAKGLDAVDLIMERDQTYYRLIAADNASPPLNMAGYCPGEEGDHLTSDSNWDLD